MPLPVTVDIPNDHLQYAVTWFGLALVWAVMTGSLALAYQAPDPTGRPAPEEGPDAVCLDPGPAPTLGFEEAMLAGLARDGGLYVPETWPAMPRRRSRRSPACPTRRWRSG